MDARSSRFLPSIRYNRSADHDSLNISDGGHECAESSECYPWVKLTDESRCTGRETWVPAWTPSRVMEGRTTEGEMMSETAKSYLKLHSVLGNFIRVGRLRRDRLPDFECGWKRVFWRAVVAWTRPIGSR